MRNPVIKSSRNNGLVRAELTFRKFSLSQLIIVFERYQ